VIMARRVTLMVVIAAMLYAVRDIGVAQVGSPFQPWLMFEQQLVQRYPYLLEPADRVAVDEINRDFRMAMRQLKNSFPEVKDRVLAQQFEFQRRMAAALEQRPGDMDFSIAMQQLRSGPVPSDLRAKAADLQAMAEKRLASVLEKTPSVVRV